MRPTGTALVAAAAALTLTAGATTAVLLPQPAPRRVVVPVREALPPPPPPPSRAPLLPAGTGGEDAPVPSAAALAALADASAADPALGGRLAVSVVDVAERRPVLERAADVLLTPASTAKIVTAVAALTTLAPTVRLTTRVVAGSTPGEVVLVGGGDTTLARDAASQRSPQDARLDVLADQALAALGPTPVTRVVVDDTLYPGPSTGPGWLPGYVAEGSVAPVDALSVDGGRVRADQPGRVPDPGMAAGALVAVRLARGGPAVPVARGRAPQGAAVLAQVQSPPVGQLVERMLTTSDNDLAETLARQVALALGRRADFDGVAAALAQATAPVLASLGVRGEAVRLVDGSGLSRDDAVAPGAFSRLLAGLLADPRPEQQARLGPLLGGLPVAGFDGTLADRFRRGPQVAGAGAVRAKTGTLRGVSSLAGVVRTRDGRLLSFAVMSDGVPDGGVLAAEQALDRFAAGLAACGCR